MKLYSIKITTWSHELSWALPANSQFDELLVLTDEQNPPALEVVSANSAGCSHDSRHSGAWSYERRVYNLGRQDFIGSDYKGGPNSLPGDRS